MPARKKRTPSPKSAHIAVQSQVSSMEDDTSVPEEKPRAVISVDSNPVSKEVEKLNEELHEVSTSEASLEEMLANDAIEPELTRKNIWMYRFGMIATCTIVFLSIGTYIVYLQSSKTNDASTMPISTPTPIPTVSVDTKTITVEVLNASGVAGKASKTAEALKAKGYSIASTGNAKKTPGTTVMFASVLSERAKDMVLADLQSIGISSISSTLGDSSVSARITLGLK